MGELPWVGGYLGLQSESVSQNKKVSKQKALSFLTLVYCLKLFFLLHRTEVLKLFCRGSAAAVKMLLHIVEEIISNQIMKRLT